jgi:hypothetical protein
MRVCVDEIETGFGELVFMLKELLRGNTTPRKDCCEFCRHEASRKQDLEEGEKVRANAFIVCFNVYVVLQIIFILFPVKFQY